MDTLNLLFMGAGVVAVSASAIYGAAIYGFIAPFFGHSLPRRLRDALVVYSSYSLPRSRCDYEKIVELLYSWPTLVDLGILPGTQAVVGSSAVGEKKAVVCEAVDEIAVVERIVSFSGMDPADSEFRHNIMPAIRRVVHGLALERNALVCGEILRGVAFDGNNSLHTSLLETLWRLLMPGVKREGDAGTRSSKSWSNIGFQGTDPITDFRGMGMLGLLQLVHFARTPAGRHVLDISQPPVGASELKFFPFACGGIQVTSLVLGLARDRKLGSVLLEGEEKVGAVGGNTEVTSLKKDTDKGDAVTLMRSLVKEAGLTFRGAWQGIELLNDVYCEIFTLVGEEWKKADPPNVMSWPIIFKIAEENVRASLLATGAERLEIRWR